MTTLRGLQEASFPSLLKLFLRVPQREFLCPFPGPLFFSGHPTLWPGGLRLLVTPRAPPASWETCANPPTILLVLSHLDTHVFGPLSNEAFKELCEVSTLLLGGFSRQNGEMTAALAEEEAGPKDLLSLRARPALTEDASAWRQARASGRLCFLSGLWVRTLSLGTHGPGVRISRCAKLPSPPY